MSLSKFSKQLLAIFCMCTCFLIVICQTYLTNMFIRFLDLAQLYTDDESSLYSGSHLQYQACSVIMNSLIVYSNGDCCFRAVISWSWKIFMICLRRK